MYLATRARSDSHAMVIGVSFPYQNHRSPSRTPVTEPQFNIYQGLKRVEAFAIARATAFTAGSEGANDFARVTPLLSEIGAPRQNPGRPASPATGAKADLFGEVRDDLEAIAATAAAISFKKSAS